MFATAKRKDLDAFFDEHPFHCNRLPTLWEKRRVAFKEYDEVESLRCAFQGHIDKYVIIIVNYNKIINNPTYLEQYASSIFREIIEGMSASIKWNTHLPTLSKLESTIPSKMHPFPSLKLTPEGTEEAHKAICSLPVEASSLIWQKLYDRCANGAQEWQWSEKHFHEHGFDLLQCVQGVHGSISQRIPKSIDPTTDTRTLSPILKDELEKMPIGAEGFFGLKPSSGSSNECSLM
jgi:hypothetical protein